MSNHRKMDSALRESIISVLTSKYGMRQSGENFAGGVCPDCGKKDLWAVGDEPWSIQCNRINNCGYKGLIRELHPELFKSVTERAESFMRDERKIDPKGIAKFYLSDERGLNPTRAGNFTQETAYNRKTGKGSATIRFYFPVANDKECFWERIIEDIGSDKANFPKGIYYSGYGWVTPEFNQRRGDVWIVEGIFDALALQEHGIRAISAMTCHNFPAKTIQSLNLDKLTTIVIALDSNKAGYEAIPKMIARVEELGFTNVQVALTRSKMDWNDCHIQDKLSPEDIELYYYNGDLFTATSAYNKALLMWKRNLWQSFIVEHDYKTYWAEVKNASGLQDKEDEEEDKEPELSLTQIGTCIIDFLYVERSIATDETRFYLDIQNSRGNDRGIFSGKHFKSPNEFGSRIIDTLPGANFSGKAHQIEKLYELKAPYIKTVHTIDYVGYCPEAKGYVYPQFAVKDGEIHLPNKEDYYSFKNYHIKNTFTPGSFNPSTNIKPVQWLDDYITAFGDRGLIVLAYFFGSLFATQIRHELGYFPFLEFTGEAGSGKTAVLEFMWKLMGRDNYEGINPTTSTPAGRYRTLNQFSNMPTSYIEGQSESKDAKKGKDDWLYESKTQFNGRSVRTKGKNNNGNDTDESPFYGSIVVSQNVKIDADEATLTRFIYLHMTSDHHTPAGKRASEKLMRLEIDDVSSFLLQTILQEKSILKIIFDKYEAIKDIFIDSDRVVHSRIRDVHKLLLAILEALTETYNIDYKNRDKAAKLIMRIAEDRQKDLDHDPEPVQEFWYLLEDLQRDENLDNRSSLINHSNNKEFELAINLNDIAKMARDRNLPPIDVTLLRKLLPKTKTFEFIENKTVKSSISGRTTRCYVFKWNGKWK
ncbi:toprim domain-containing protein [Ignatzschineria rhizosphaerae]|uniref:Toprim domain-containing protein n=1 Tax=Ignatzschineria rhizosphaerae TaxID=2923279 RepID=A0ABY3WY44_9GAMM|nr:toprim domain-containing protein [Ignatzschineria rhizosphaerae]UNM95533.1 toprim domain-containing protein [Ignatzschineria rhizosphaerae]